MRSRLSVFSQHTDDVLQEAIDAAETLVTNKTGLGDVYDEAVLWRAADLLGTLPQGKHSRLVSRENEGKTLYYKQYERIIRERLGGPRVI